VGTIPFSAVGATTSLGATVGKRFGAARRLGTLFGFSYDYNGRGIDDVEPAIDSTSTPSRILYKSNSDREYMYYRTRYGISGSVDYKVSDFTDFYVKGVYSDLKDFGEKWYYSPSATSAAKFYTSSKSPEYSIGSVSAGGHHFMTSSWIAWEVSAGRSYQTASAGNPKGRLFLDRVKTDLRVRSHSAEERQYARFGNNCEGPNSPLQVASNWGFLDITTSKGITAQLNLSAAATYNKTYQVGTHHWTFEAGGKVRNGHKYQNGTETVYDGWTASQYPMTQFLGDFSSTNYYQGAYYGGHYGPVSDFK